jgi:hypothetical protein
VADKQAGQDPAVKIVRLVKSANPDDVAFCQSHLDSASFTTGLLQTGTLFTH